jgi:cobalamin synthase
MENGILSSCGLFALTALCLYASLSPVIAQQSQPTREGIITSFAPLVEKAASVVTVFTTQTVSRGQTAFSLARFSGQRLRSYAPANADTQAASHSRF